MFQIILHGDIFGTAISNVVCGTYFKRRKRGDMLLKITNKKFFYNCDRCTLLYKNPYLQTFFLLLKKVTKCTYFSGRERYMPPWERNLTHHRSTVGFVSFLYINGIKLIAQIDSEIQNRVIFISPYMVLGARFCSNDLWIQFERGGE